MQRKSVKRPKKLTALNTLKRNLSGKQGTAFEILDDVKKVKPQQWKSSSQVEQLARKYIDKLGLSVPEQRIQQFMDAYKDAIRNGSNADELIQKYGKNVDKETVKTLKKYVPK
jgi:adenine-specific DNA methylase